jgi:hypothetical protein
MKKLTKIYTISIACLIASTTLALCSSTESESEIDLTIENIVEITTTTIEDLSVENRQFVLSESKNIQPTTTTTIAIPEEALCPQFWELALVAGWDESLLPTLDRIIHRESTCRPTSHNAKDPAGGSYGLTQINGYWCNPNKYNPSGYLQAFGIINTCDDLYDPLVNLKAALKLYEYSFNRHGCGWNPWRFC